MPRGRRAAAARGPAAPVEALEAALAARGLKVTRPRRLIAGVVLGAGAHLPIDEIHRRAREALPSVGLATVYRTMRLLVEAGLVEERRFADGVPRYERAHGRPAHAHLVCLSCGEVIEFGGGEGRGDGRAGKALEVACRAAARRHGFAPRRLRIEVSGLCRACRREEKFTSR